MRVAILSLCTLLSLPAAAGVSPSLSAQEVDDLLAGRGMGLSRPAERNGHPGPAHALELAADLGLTVSQIDALSAAKTRMSAASQALGRQIVEREQELVATFAEQRADADTVTRLNRDIAALQGELRAVHLLAHLEATAVLGQEQIRRYSELRGYGATPHLQH